MMYRERFSFFFFSSSYNNNNSFRRSTTFLFLLFGGVSSQWVYIFPRRTSRMGLFFFSILTHTISQQHFGEVLVVQSTGHQAYHISVSSTLTLHIIIRLTVFQRGANVSSFVHPQTFFFSFLFFPPFSSHADALRSPCARAVVNRYPPPPRACAAVLFCFIKPRSGSAGGPGPFD